MPGPQHGDELILELLREGPQGLVWMEAGVGHRVQDPGRGRVRVSQRCLTVPPDPA